MKNKRKGFDFDGTIADHKKTKTKYCVEKGIRVEEWQTNSNLFEGFLNALDKKLYKQISNSLYREKTASAEVFPDALEALWFLRTFGHEIFIVSARHVDSRRYALDWLENNRFFSVIKDLNVFFCEEKEKPYVLKELGICTYVDDKISVLESLDDSINKILFDDQFLVVEKKIILPKGIHVVTNWPDVRIKINQIQRAVYS